MSRPWEPDELAEINRWRVVPDRLRHWARTEPDRTFFRCGSGWLTFGQVDSKTDAIAGGLSKIGITKGDRVAVMLPNCEEAYLGILALAKLGAIQVPLNAYLKGEFLRHQLGDSGTMCLLSDAPGIAEALITTAAGLFVAIPAVIFYNQFLQNIRDLAQRLDTFALEVGAQIEKTFT